MASTVKNCYLIINGKKYGPVSEQDILRLYEQKKINGSTKFAKSGAKEWITLSKTGILVSDINDDLPPLPTDGQKQKNSAVLLPTFINATFALALGIIGQILGSVTKIYGSLRGANDYGRAADAFVNASGRLALLTVFGVILFVIGIIFLIAKLKTSNSTLKHILWFVPMGITVVYAFINYIPIINFLLNWK